MSGRFTISKQKHTPFESGSSAQIWIAPMPKRIQLKRRKGWRKPANTVVVTRPGKWGNPFLLSRPTQAEYENGTAMMDAMHGVCITAEATVNRYKRFLRSDPDGRKICRAAKKELRGKNLACWCKAGAPCHADVLLEIAATGSFRP